MKKILIILGHPSNKSLNFQIANSYEKGAKDSGFQVKRLNIRDLNFDPILHEGYNEKQELEKDLIKTQKDILWADHIVWVFPIWWGGLPTLLKGFIDRVFLPGFAFKFKENSYMPERFLKGKTSRIITTTGGPKFIYFFLGNGIIVFKRFVLSFCGIGPVKTKHFSLITKASQKRLNQILKKSEKLGNKGN